MVIRKSRDDVRLALALAIINARRRFTDTGGELRWKKKAKLLKEEVLALRQELQEVQAAATLEKMPALAACECLFLQTGIHDNPGRRLPVGDEQMKFSLDCRNELTQEIVKLDSCETSQEHNLVLVVDFIVDLMGDAVHILSSRFNLQLFLERPSAVAFGNQYFAAYIHQSVAFVKDTMPQLLEESMIQSINIESTVKKLTSTLSTNIINFSSEKVPEVREMDERAWNQRIILQLGSIPYVGQQFLVTISRLIAEAAHTLVCVDPFHDGVAQTYNNLFFLLEIFERLFSDHLYLWAQSASLDEGDQGRISLQRFVSHIMLDMSEDFGDWSSLVAVYTSRITGEIVTQLYRIVASDQKGEGSKHKALLHLVQAATSTISKS